MKKHLLFLIINLISLCGIAQTFTDTNFIEYTIIPSTNNVEVTEYDFPNGGVSVNIPASVVYNGATYNVTKIGDQAFLAFGATLTEKITSVIIPNSVTSIGFRSFQGNLLTSVILPDSVTQLDNLSFGENPVLDSITLSNNLTTIAQSSFVGCGLTSLTIPSSVTTIGSNAFAVNQLTSITIPSTVTVIETRAFINNPLTCVISEGTTPASVVTPLGGNTSTDSFSSNRSNIDLSIPSATASVYAAAGWTGFNSVAEGLTGTFVVDHITYQILSNSNNEVYIYDYDTAGGTVVNIPATVVSSCTSYSVTEIGYQSFKDKGLTQVTMPNSVTNIAYQAFRQNMITSVTLSNSLTNIANGAFFSNLLVNVVIPDSVITIDSSAFSGNVLTSVVIPNNVTDIGSNAFAANQLTSVTLGTGLLTIESQAFINNLITSVVIPDNVTDFGERAFQSNQLTSVTLGTGDNSIGEDSFRFNNITSVIIPDNVTSIGPDAFAHNQLTSIIIPDNVTSISNGAFNNNNLSSIDLGDNLIVIGQNAFSSNSLTNVIIPASVTTMGILTFGFNPNLNAVTSLATIPPTISTGGSLDTFGNFAFRPGIDLYIPVGTTAAYTTDAGALWTNFGTVTEGTLSTSNFELDNDIILYTTNDIIKMSFSNQLSLESYTLYNLSGVQVSTGKETNISTSSLANGIYILKLDFDTGTLIKKIAIN